MRAERILRGKTNGLVSFDTSPFCVFARDACKLLKDKIGLAVSISESFAGCGCGILNDFAGRVGEWLKPADCKSAAPCGLRRFESFPVHQALVVGMTENRRAIAGAMFESGPIRGASAAQEECAAKDDF